MNRPYIDKCTPKDFGMQVQGYAGAFHFGGELPEHSHAVRLCALDWPKGRYAKPVEA